MRTLLMIIISWIFFAMMVGLRCRGDGSDCEFLCFD